MKILGIAGSPRAGRTTERLVTQVLDGCDGETELVRLAGKKIRPCVACLGCVKTNVCVLEDDMQALREKIAAADGYVIGAPNYFSMLNGLTHCFLERWYQFRHNGASSVAGKFGVAIGVGGGDPAPVLKNIEAFFQYNQIECVGAVAAQGAASCFECGYGESCQVGAIHMFFGPGTKITEEIIPCLEKQPEAMQNARAVGKALTTRIADEAQRA